LDTILDFIYALKERDEHLIKQIDEMENNAESKERQET
jgi:hypothetical protein